MKVKLRDYQREAVDWALKKGQSIICMPTGTGKTIIAAAWIKELLRRGLARKILVLEPTRFMVEQTARVFKSLGLPAEPVHGSLSRGIRRRGWSAVIVVATPEIVASEGLGILDEPDALVVDECHHTTGQDPYVDVAKAYKPRWRLGLTAFLPPSRRREIEDYIGDSRCWSWEDPRLKKYIPPWVGEVYEAPLNDVEENLYKTIEKLWDSMHGVERVILGNALRWLVRDGAEALRESYSKGGLLHRLLEGVEGLLYNPMVRPAHKLPSLLRVLRDHEGFRKAIVFVDRIIIARIIGESTREYNPVLLLGRRHIDPKQALGAARREESKLIVATSAGEEGIDLPEADLLVIWSHTASPLRFIQRLGRILRPGEGRQKTAVFIATPDTIDMDSLIDGIVEAERAGVRVGIEPEVIEWIWSMSQKRRALEVLEQRPLTLDLLSQAIEAPLKRLESLVKWLVDRGYAVYIYTPYGRVYGSKHSIDALYKYYKEYLTPELDLHAQVRPYAGKPLRQVRGPYQHVLNKLIKLLEKHGYFNKVTGHIRVRVGAVERLVQAVYSYRIDNEETLKLILDNIYSAKRWLKHEFLL